MTGQEGKARAVDRNVVVSFLRLISRQSEKGMSIASWGHSTF